MPLPAMLTFNELTGEEVREILENRCRQVFERVPQFQRHITLPRVKITLNVKLELWADQPHPETISIGDSLTVVVETEPDVIEAQSVDAAAPIPGGHPPDQIREIHGLSVSRPERGPKDVGGQISYADQSAPTAPVAHDAKYAGLTVKRNDMERDPHDFADPLSGYGTFVTIDQGPAGLKRGDFRRQSFDDMRHGVPAKKPS